MEQNKSMYHTIINQITGIFLPIINYLTAASILKSLMVLGVNLGILETQSGVYQILYQMDFSISYLCF